MKYLLPEICEIQYGFAFDSKEFSDEKRDDNIPIIRIRDVNKGFSETYYNGDYDECYIIHKNDLLIGMDGEFNISRWKSDDALLNQRVCKISANDSVDEEYLRFMLVGKLKEIERKTAFVTVKHLSAKELNKMKVELPSQSEQTKRANTLSVIEQIKRELNKELDNLNGLISSRFVEMFGDPKLNPNRWPVKKVGELVTDVRYGTSRAAVEGGKYPYLRMNNLTNDGHLDLTNLKYIDIPDNELEKCLVRRGDILFNRTNSIDLIGKTAVFNLEQDMIIAGYIIRVRLKDALLPEIFSLYFNLEYMKDALKKMAKGAVNQANINAQELQSINIYVPPIEKQNAFVEFLQSIDKSKAVIQKSLDEAQLLFDSLMQEYFG